MVAENEASSRRLRYTQWKKASAKRYMRLHFHTMGVADPLKYTSKSNRIENLHGLQCVTLCHVSDGEFSNNIEANVTNHSHEDKEGPRGH